MKVTSANIAASIEATAKELAAAMALYQRLPAKGDALAAAAEAHIEKLNELFGRLMLKRGGEKK